MADDTPPTVQKHHSFFWNTNLSEDRMRAISDWLGSLDEDKRQMVCELLRDQRDEAAFDAAGESQ